MKNPLNVGIYIYFMIVAERPFLDGKVIMYLSKNSNAYVLRCFYKRIRVGYCYFDKDYNNDGKIIYVDDLIVEEKYQRKGLGTMMMKYIICLAELEGKSVNLTSTINAIQFYRTLGLRKRRDSSQMYYKPA